MWQTPRVDSLKLAKLCTRSENAHKVRYARKLSFLIMWLLHVQLLGVQKRYGLERTVMINLLELPIKCRSSKQWGNNSVATLAISRSGTFQGATKSGRLSYAEIIEKRWGNYSDWLKFKFSKLHQLRPTSDENFLWKMGATQPMLLAPLLQPSCVHHSFVATYLSILLRNNGRYFRNLFETCLLSFVGQGPAQWFSNVHELWLPSTFNMRLLNISKFVLSTMGVSKESISKFLTGNRFHVKLRILSPENCKQSLRVSWKAEVTNLKLQSKFRNTSSKS